MASRSADDMRALLGKAQALVDDTRTAQALEPALEALEIGRSLGDDIGVATAARLAIAAYGFQRKAKQAKELGDKELQGFVKKGNGKCEALVMLGLAEGFAGDRAVQHAQDAQRKFAEQGDRDLEAQALLALAATSLRGRDKRGAAEQAKQAATDAVAIFQSLGDAKGHAAALHRLAEARVAGGGMDAALRAAREAADMYHQADSKLCEASVLRSIATWLLDNNEDLPEAVRAATQAMDILEEAFIFADACETPYLETAVKAFMQAKDHGQAVQLAKYGVERFQDAGLKQGEALALEVLSTAYSGQGNLTKAIRASGKAVHAHEDAGDELSRAAALRTTSRLLLRTGQLNKAMRLSQEAFEVFENVDDLKETAATLQLRAEIYMARQQTANAIRCATEARESFQDAKDVRGEIRSLLQLAEVELANDDTGRAGSSAEEAQALAAEIGDSEGEAKAYRLIADISMRSEQYEAAIKAGQRALALYRELGDSRADEVDALMQISDSQIMLIMKKEEQGKATEKGFRDTTDKALKTAKEALSVARKLNNTQLVAAVLRCIAQCHTTTARASEAMKAAEEGLRLFKQCGDLHGEAGMLLVFSNIQLVLAKDFDNARGAAEEAVFIFQQVKDGAMEARAWEMLDRVEATLDEIRRQQMMKQSPMQQMQMPTQMTSGPVEEAPSAMPSMAREGYEAQIGKLDMGGLTVEAVHKTITEVAKALIGEDEEIEVDMPLMEAGLTSNTAVMLRDQLITAMPGINLPVTLTFDYPSIGAMGELVLENAAKAKK